MPKQLQIKNICRTCLLNYHMWESVTTCTLNSTYIVKFIVYSPNCKVKLMLLIDINVYVYIIYVYFNCIIASYRPHNNRKFIFSEKRKLFIVMWPV